MYTKDMEIQVLNTQVQTNGLQHTGSLSLIISSLSMTFNYMVYGGEN